MTKSKFIKGLSCGLVLGSAMLFARLDAQVRVGVQAGVNMSNFVPRMESKMGMGALLGAVAEYQTRSPWLFRVEMNWTHHYLQLRNFNLETPQSSMLNYRMYLHTLHIPLSIGYKFQLAPELSLALRAGVGIRHGLNISSGVVTSRAVSLSEQPASLSIHPFKDESGQGLPSKDNPSGYFNYRQFQRTKSSLHLALDANLSRHWQVGLRYEISSGRYFIREDSSRDLEWKAGQFQSIAGTIAYFF